MGEESASKEINVDRLSKHRLTIVILIALLLFVIIISANIGFSHVSPVKILKIFAERLPLVNDLISSSDVSEVEETIIVQIRMPRILAGVLVGAALSTAGVVFQGLFRNPMADPYVIGISAGASLGAALAIVLGIGISVFGLSTVPILAFMGALLSAFVVYNIARVGSTVPVTTLLLSGITFSIFLSAVVAFLSVIAGEELHALIFWLTGSFSHVEWVDIWSTLPLIALGTVVVYLFARDLNILLMGEETAQHLGVEVEKLKRILLIFGSLITAAAVSIGGLIGFVGLMIPHLMRVLVGPDHRVLIPASLLVGAITLVLCDAVARVVFAPTELPVGMITTMSGGPFFLYLLRKKKGKYQF